MSSYILDKALASRAADVLRFAAAPTFAVLALFAGLSGGYATTALCSSLPNGSPLDGMSFMYLLMAVFHAVPWLKLIARSRSSIKGCISC